MWLTQLTLVHFICVLVSVSFRSSESLRTWVFACAVPIEHMHASNTRTKCTRAFTHTRTHTTTFYTLKKNVCFWLIASLPYWPVQYIWYYLDLSCMSLFRMANIEIVFSFVATDVWHSSVLVCVLDSSFFRPFARVARAPFVNFGHFTIFGSS